MAAKPKGGVGLLIGLSPKKGGASEPDDDDMESEGDDASMEVKRSAARALMSALKSSDVDAFIEAFDAYKAC